MKIDVLDIGVRVVDDLTQKETTIVGVVVRAGKTNRGTYPSSPVVGYWVDSDYLGGTRFPWEITEINGELEP